MSNITIQAEVTGTVWKIVAVVGEEVQEDQALMILESMKMEIPSTASQRGVVKQILVEEGQAVREGQDLAVIALA